MKLEYHCKKQSISIFACGIHIYFFLIYPRYPLAWTKYIRKDPFWLLFCEWRFSFFPKKFFTFHRSSVHKNRGGYVLVYGKKGFMKIIGVGILENLFAVKIEINWLWVLVFQFLLVCGNTITIYQIIRPRCFFQRNIFDHGLFSFTK